MYKLKIVAVDDNPDILDLLESSLREEYDVIMAETGQQALDTIRSEFPDLVVLDYMLPDILGTEVCQQLRKDPLFLHLPVLMLTGKGELDDKITGLEAGADDYMVKPFAPPELLARVRMLIRRSTTNLDANPLTRLPGNVSINKELQHKIATQEPFAALYIDIDNFKALNDYYGFERGDALIKETARIIINAVQKEGTVNDFLGHIGGDDYVVITVPDNAQAIAQKIIADFDSISSRFFDEKERLAGYLETKGRDSQIHKYSFPTISIGIVTNRGQTFTHTEQVNTLGAEIKSAAKKFPESKYIIDRRSDY